MNTHRTTLFGHIHHVIRTYNSFSLIDKPDNKKMVVTPYFPMNNSGLTILPFFPSSGNSLANETATTIPTKKKFFDTNAFALLMYSLMVGKLGMMLLTPKLVFGATTSAYSAVLLPYSISTTSLRCVTGNSIGERVIIRLEPPRMMENAPDFTGRADDESSKATATRNGLPRKRFDFVFIFLQFQLSSPALLFYD